MCVFVGGGMRVQTHMLLEAGQVILSKKVCPDIINRASWGR